MAARMIRVVAPVSAAGLFLAANVGGQPQKEHEHPPSAGKGIAVLQTDDRTVLAIGPAAEAGLKLTMREHLEAIRDIVAALGRQEFEQAAKLAHEEPSFPKHHLAMQREAGATSPPKYHELAMAHHQQAEDLAKMISSEDIKTVLPQLEKTIGACVACHRAYKL